MLPALSSRKPRAFHTSSPRNMPAALDSTVTPLPAQSRLSHQQSSHSSSSTGSEGPCGRSHDCLVLCIPCSRHSPVLRPCTGSDCIYECELCACILYLARTQTAFPQEYVHASCTLLILQSCTQQKQHSQADSAMSSATVDTRTQFSADQARMAPHKRPFWVVFRARATRDVQLQTTRSCQ